LKILLRSRASIGAVCYLWFCYLWICCLRCASAALTQLTLISSKLNHYLERCEEAQCVHQGMDRSARAAFAATDHLIVIGLSAAHCCHSALRNWRVWDDPLLTLGFAKPPPGPP